MSYSVFVLWALSSRLTRVLDHRALDRHQWCRTSLFTERLSNCVCCAYRKRNSFQFRYGSFRLSREALGDTRKHRDNCPVEPCGPVHRG